MNIVVIICTFNREKCLPTALRSVAVSQLPPAIKWEVLVVDNNSNDDTRKIVGDFITRYPGRFRYLFEAQPGKSYALNSGIRSARADLLAFMDDDVTVHEHWLQSLTAELHSGEWAGSGGRVLPQWNSVRPDWLPQNRDEANSPLALFDRGLIAGPLTDSPFGTNMAFRSEMFEKYGGFRTDLGPMPGSEIRGEDTEFGDRLLRAGEKLRYEPSAVVYHPVTRDRLNKAYFLAWWFDKARSEVLSQVPSARRQLSVCGIPILPLFRLSAWVLRWTGAVGHSRCFSNKIKVWYLAGHISECVRQARFAKRCQAYHAKCGSLPEADRPTASIVSDGTPRSRKYPVGSAARPE